MSEQLNIQTQDETVEARQSTLNLIHLIRNEVSQDSFDTKDNLVAVLDKVVSLMDRGRIRLYEDFIELSSYLVVIKDYILEKNYSEVDAEVTAINTVLDKIMQRHWYVVNTYSGHENRVKENLERRVETMGIEDALYQILVAEEEEIEVRNDKQIKKMRNLYPGYLFVEMIMTDEAWYVVRNTPGVTGFIGSSGGGAKPFPVSDEEIESILQRIGMTELKVIANFEVGDFVKILNGPFRGIEGTVESMSDETSKANILTTMFGRETLTEVGYLDLQKVD